MTEYHIWFEERFHRNVTDPLLVAEVIDDALARDIPPDKITIYRHDMEEFREAVHTELMETISRLNPRRKPRS